MSTQKGEIILVKIGVQEHEHPRKGGGCEDETAGAPQKG